MLLKRMAGTVLVDRRFTPNFRKRMERFINIHNEYEDVVDDAGTDVLSVIDKEQKASDFDDHLVSLVKPKAFDLRESIERNALALTEFTEKQIRDKAEASNQDQLLRVSFWEEVTNATNEKRPINEAKIWTGVCTNAYWRKVKRELDWKMAYVLIPIKEYQKTLKLLHSLGQQAMIDIMNANMFQGKKLITPIAKLKLEAFKVIDDRVKGKAVSRLQSHHTETKVEEKLTTAEIQAKIDKLEQELIPQNNTIDVEAKVVG